MRINYRYLIDYLDRHLPRGGGGRALDYGCGKADVVVAARQGGLDVYGADIFYKDGASREDVEEKGLLGTYVREIVDGRLDFPDQHFDLVFSNQVFEHVEDLDLALGEIRRVMKPDAVLHTLFPVSETWWEGHFGIPFLHNLRAGSRSRLLYARLWFLLGGGYHHSGRTSREWAEYVCQWVDNYTTYRPRREIERLLAAHDFSFAYEERGYMLFRLGESSSSSAALARQLARFPAVPLLMKLIYRKRAGIVITARKQRHE